MQTLELYTIILAISEARDKVLASHLNRTCSCDHEDLKDRPQCSN